MTDQLVRLGDVADMLVGFSFKSQHFLEASADGVKLVRGDNVQQGFIRWGAKTKKWRGDTYDDVERYQLRLNDVILAMDRPIVGGGLKLAWVKGEDLPCLLVQRVTRIRGVMGVALTNYLRYALSAPDFCAHIHGITTGANIPHISGRDIASFEFRLPAIAEQQRTVDLIASYDDLIETNRRRIALLEESAQLLYREWFVNLRFPGHETAVQKDGLPEGWCRERLDQALFLQRGFDLPNGARVAGDIPVYASTGVGGFHNEARVKGPGVVTGRSGTLGGVRYVPEDYWPLNTVLWVKEFRRVRPIVAFFMLSELNLAQFNSGASVPTLDRKVVHAEWVTIPPVEEIGRAHV